ncbi:MAG: PIG-L family deacetylase [Brevibacterium sp.]
MSFDHLDAGTPEDAWRQAGVLGLPMVPADIVADEGTVLVLAAHPDDEALGAAAVVASARDRETDVSVLLFTAGEKSHPHSSTHSAKRLEEIRLQEFDSALSVLNPAATSRCLEFPDTELPGHSEQVLNEVLAEIAASRRPVTIVAPFHDDGHGDHDTLGSAALEAGRRSGSLVLEYPIWYWHWATPDDARWRQWTFLPDPAGLDRHEVFEHYRSQTQPLSNRPGDEPVLDARHLDHHQRGGDILAVTDFRVASASKDADEVDRSTETAPNDARTAAAVFDAVHADRDDPWSVTDSAYERAKRDMLLGHLPQDHYSHILELGCSIGVLSRKLAEHARWVTAIDASRKALDRAEQQVPEGSGISFVHGTIPFEWPAGSFDCVVLSETGFYLSRHQLHRTLQRIDACTAPRFTLVLCHLRGEIEDWPLDADEVHDSCLSFWPHRRIEFHHDARYRLDIVTVTKTPESDESTGDW